ncbi:MAG: hypothetical protein M9944_07825 [Rhizobiaceae bacterium]|nr:hypothetical protein [Rhizobiaceae bacterium]
MSDNDYIAAVRERLDAMSWLQLAALHDVQARDAEAHAHLEWLSNSTPDCGLSPHTFEGPRHGTRQDIHTRD